MSVELKFNIIMFISIAIVVQFEGPFRYCDSGISYAPCIVIFDKKCKTHKNESLSCHGMKNVV